MLGPNTVRMPSWPGPVLAIGGAILAVGAASARLMVASGQLDADLRLLGWLALAGAVAFVAGLVYAATRQLRVRRYLPPERYRGPAVLLLLALVVVVATIFQIPFGNDILALTGEGGELTPLGAAVVLLSTPVALLLVSWWFVLRPRALAGLPSWMGPDPVRALGIGVLAGIGMWVLGNLVGAAVIALLQALGIGVDTQLAERAVETLDPWLVVLVVIFLAPVAEELFFRGVVFNAWLREGGVRWAFIGSTLLFALIHLSIAAFVPILLLGFALAWIYRRTQSLLAPIALHATFNGISVVLVLLTRFDILKPPV
ncbi:MAG TPA: type II CAAX endopeptidase family protein [Candidatus Limnocylindria bacterium]|nr:type II CAAX endopeptidase family protein [Candidatus Limnocylindria bacterium]